ncbi:MAG: hypothetical protein WAQ05_23065 [Rubrivivax sp.]
MQFHRIALAAAAAVAATAVQAAPAVNIDDAATVKVYLSGASALRATIAGVVLNDICGGSATNSSTTLYNVAESGSGFTFSGNYWAISCNVTAAGGAKVGLSAGTPVAFFKSDAGGSAQGVFPVYFQDDRLFAQPVPLSGCTTATTADRVYSGCPATRAAKAMFGVSDVEPGLFKGVNVPNNDPSDLEDDTYPGDGLTGTQLAQMRITPVVQTVFGVAVNNNLYAAMFAKQNLAAKKDASGAACTTASSDETCTPTIGYAEARSLFQGGESNWRLLVAGSDSKLDTQVNVCRRVNGSGTQAGANAGLLQFPCNGNSLAPADYASSSSAAPEAVSQKTALTESGLTMAQYADANMGGAAVGGAYPAMPSGTLFVFEGPGTGDVVTCLNRANNGGGYAIGHVSKENAPGSNLWKHVRLEGAAASRDNLKNGRYDYAFESTMQYLTSAYNALTAQQRGFITGFIAESRKPDALAKLSSANQQGVAALPSAYAGAFGTGTANEIAFGSRVTRAGNSCTPFTAVK